MTFQPVNPNGFPHVGLWNEHVARLELSAAFPHTTIVGLSRTRPDAALDILHTVASLSRIYPKVTVDSISLNSRAVPADTLAQAVQYPLLYPTLRQMRTDGTLTRSDANDYTNNPARWTTKATREYETSLGVRDISTAGSLLFGPLLTHAGRYREMTDFWARRDARLARRGSPVQHLARDTSPLSHYASHEFGHLIAGVLEADGVDRIEPCFAELSAVVFGRHPNSTRQWKHHLVNYPAQHTVAAGPAYRPERRRTLIKTVGPAIGAALGRMARINRDELFAEAFAYAHCGTRPLRQQLSPFRDAVERALEHVDDIVHRDVRNAA